MNVAYMLQYTYLRATQPSWQGQYIIPLTLLFWPSYSKETSEGSFLEEAEEEEYRIIFKNSKVPEVLNEGGEGSIEKEAKRRTLERAETILSIFSF